MNEEAIAELRREMTTRFERIDARIGPVDARVILTLTKRELVAD